MESNRTLFDDIYRFYETCDLLRGQLVISDGKSSRLTVPHRKSSTSFFGSSSFITLRWKGECCWRSHSYLVSKFFIYWSMMVASWAITYGKIKGGTQTGRSDGKNSRLTAPRFFSSVTIFIGSSTEKCGPGEALYRLQFVHGPRTFQKIIDRPLGMATETPNPARSTGWARSLQPINQPLADSTIGATTTPPSWYHFITTIHGRKSLIVH